MLFGVSQKAIIYQILYLLYIENSQKFKLFGDTSKWFLTSENPFIQNENRFLCHYKLTNCSTRYKSQRKTANVRLKVWYGEYIINE